MQKYAKEEKNCTVYRLYVIRTNPLENILHLEIPSRSSSNSGHCRRMCYEYSRWKIPRTKIHLQLFTCQIQMLTGRNGAHTHTHIHTHLIFSAMGQASSSAVAAVEENRGIGVALTTKQRWLYDTNPKNTVLWANLSKWPYMCIVWFHVYFNDPPNKWTWFTLEKVNPVTGQKTPQRQTAGTWKDPSIESNGTWYVINDEWQVI